MQGPREQQPEVGHAGAGRYVAAWVALLVLTGTTFGLSHAHLGPFALPASLTIAAVKATVVVLFFMHLWEHTGANRLVLITSVVFALLLLGLTIADVATRFPLAVPHEGFMPSPPR